MIFDHEYVDAALIVEVTTPTSDTATVTVAGEIDRDNYAQLERVFTDLVSTHRPRRVAFDLARVTFMGSDGIRALLICRRKAEQANAEIEIIRAHQRVREVLTLINLQHILNMAPDCANEH
ncbi:STAS domain-containing protein [Actinoplanes sp. CA-142083]|uniref:STAS domain-containing protein n=1 Tax=Actinoplanes sp. CA-142083 TaxID=3239903 RepID=UPI003D8F8D1D